jgi:hypothetical protein
MYTCWQLPRPSQGASWHAASGCQPGLLWIVTNSIYHSYQTIINKIFFAKKILNKILFLLKILNKILNIFK